MRKISSESWLCVAAALVAVCAIAYQQTATSSPPAPAASSYSPFEGAIATEAVRLRAAAGRDNVCVERFAELAGERKDKAIVECFIDRLEIQNRAAIGTVLFRAAAIDKAKSYGRTSN